MSKSRGVVCAVCGKELFYIGDKRFLDEVWVIVKFYPKCWEGGIRNSPGCIESELYIHHTCWAKLAKNNFKFRPEEHSRLDIVDYVVPND